jgi:hypothetical protein
MTGGNSSGSRRYYVSRPPAQSRDGGHRNGFFCLIVRKATSRHEAIYQPMGTRNRTGWLPIVLNSGGPPEEATTTTCVRIITAARISSAIVRSGTTLFVSP